MRWLSCALLTLYLPTADATVFLPPICHDKNHRAIDCPKHDTRDREFGKEAKRSIEKTFKEVVHGKAIINNRNDRFEMYGLPRWVAPPYLEDRPPGDPIGTCVIAADYFDFEDYLLRHSRRYVHSEVSERTCANEEARLKTGKLLEPFPELKGKRVFCNIDDPRACAGAAYEIGKLARRPVESLLEDASIALFGMSAGVHPRREREVLRFSWEFGATQDMHINIEYGDPGVEYSSWCASSLGWRVCRSLEPTQTLIFSAPHSPY